MEDVQTVFRNKALLDTIWESVQEKLTATGPTIDAELKHIHNQRTKNQAALDRHFQAFESGTMSPAACNQSVQDLSAQIKQLDNQCQALKEKRSALDLPAIKTDFLHEILTNLRAVVEAVPIPQKKHLLHLLVKKVLIRDKHTYEVWYRLPQFPGVRTLSKLVAPRGQCAKQLGVGPLSPMGQAVFCVSTGSRGLEDQLPDVRIRLAG